MEHPPYREDDETLPSLQTDLHRLGHDLSSGVRLLFR
jgi:hypothetical protein